MSKRTLARIRQRSWWPWPGAGAALLLAAGLAACSGGGTGGANFSSASESVSPSLPGRTANVPATAAVSASSNATATSSTTEASKATSPAADTPPASPRQNASLNPDEEAALLRAFEEQAQSDMTAAELNEALDDKLAKVRPATGDALVRAMLAYYDRRLPGMQAKFEPENVQQALWGVDGPPAAAEIDQIADAQARALVQQALSGGYKLETAEGMVFPVVDYGRLKRADARVTAAMRDYIALLAVESDRKSASDGGLVIERAEVAARAAQAEAYVAAHPDAPERSKAEDLFAARYIPFLLMGLDNTPVFDYDTFKIDPQVKDALQKAAADDPGTATAKLTQAFLNVLDRTGGAIYKKGDDGAKIDIPEVKAFYDGLEARARKLLDGAKPNR